MDLSATVDDLCEDARVMAPKLSIEAKLAPDISVMADQDLLQQLLQNLVNNAIKYNRDGGLIQVGLSADGEHASVRVSNTGPGIPPGDRERIFDRFHRVDAARGREVDGFGLGLSLSREIARAHDGALELERSDDALTTFVLRLPVVAGLAPSLSEANTPE
jgi:signal transduction histidine kinase